MTVHRALRLIALIMGLMMASLSVSAQPLTALSTTRSTNAYLSTGGQIVSGPNGTHTLVVQNDGNLVIYNSGCIGNPSCAVWNSGSSGPQGNHFLAMQSDGNLVMYRGVTSDPVAAVPVWGSGVTSAPGAFYVAVGDDGNLVVYRGGPTDNRGAFWSRATGYVAPANDAFANRIQLGSATSGTSLSSTSRATTEVGEPQPSGMQNGTVWWQWTAPSSGVVTFDTFGSDFDTGLTVWTGNSLSGLSNAVFNDNVASGGLQSQLSFNASAGTTYQIRVGGQSEQGSVNLNWNYGLPPQTISFSPLAPKPVLSAPFTVSATASSGLPVSFSSSTPAVCSVSGSTVTLLRVGVCTLAANQAGNASFAAAPTVAQSFAVTSQIATSTYHTCALTNAGAVRCWGNNQHGQLGNNSTSNSQTPVPVSGLSSGVVAIATGERHTCALTNAGAVQCWGDNAVGQLGDNSTTQSLTPVAVSGLSSGVVAITAGDLHTCAITNAGGVQCWGFNQYGQLGDNSNTLRQTPVAVSGLSSGVVAIAADFAHTCAITNAGGVKCWGWNQYGQLGDNSTIDSRIPMVVSGLSSGVVAIATGFAHTCAITNAGGVQCWGWNGGGQLGDDSTTNRLTPVAVSGLSSGVVAVEAGYVHTCALTGAGAVQCWGTNQYGQLGDNSSTQRKTPVAVSGLSSGVVAMAAGLVHTCALTNAGAVQCWGSNAAGQLGDNTTTNRLTPVAVSGPGGVGTLNLAVQASSTSLTVSPQSTSFGNSITLTATISGNTPTGTVQFKDGTSNLGAPVAVVDGAAVLVTQPLGSGSRSITATYSGDSVNEGSVSAAAPLTVSKATTNTSALSVSPINPVAGSAVTLSVSVSGSASPTGQVEFFDGNTSLGTATLNAGGAALQTSALGAGAHSLSARYLGDANNANSDSAVLPVTVAASGPGEGESEESGDTPLPAWALALLAAGLLARMNGKRSNTAP